jgi:hypothetical protein
MDSDQTKVITIFISLTIYYFFVLGTIKLFSSL